MATHAEGKWWRTCHTRKQSSYIPLQYLVGLCGICGTFCALAHYELVPRILFHISIKPDVSFGNKSLRLALALWNLYHET
jgi:hypothetical protein